MKRILALLLITLCFSGCEKDDICTDETTPRLIVEFYDISNPANLKNVLNLKVKAEGADDFIIFNESLPIDDEDRYLFNGNKLELPLKINDSITKYSLVLNSTSTANANEDFLQFNYTPQNVFVSRGCGFKTIFTLNAAPDGVIKTDAFIPDNFWILDFSILTTNITTENETHIKILF
jgi:hypothetical protein